MRYLLYRLPSSCPYSYSSTGFKLMREKSYSMILIIIKCVYFRSSSIFKSEVKIWITNIHTQSTNENNNQLQFYLQ